MPYQYDVGNQHLHLHYDQPAATWPNALPVGNGRLGAMVYGRPDAELVQFNEDSVWYGGAQKRTPNAARHLPELRRLIRAGQHAEAEQLARRHFFSSPLTSRVYEPLGQMKLEFGHKNVTAYKRWLDLSTATHTTVYQFTNAAGSTVSVRRDVIASYPDQTILMRVTASEKIEFTVRLNRKSEIEYATEQCFDSLQSDGQHVVLHATPGGKNSSPLCLVLGASVDVGGSVEPISSGLVISATECTLAIGAQTTFRCTDPESAAIADVDAALKQPWNDLLKRHVASYTSLFDRVALRLLPDASHVPTDERLKGTGDAGLAALYHNYGRYLLISSSRSGHRALPANLQGIWNPTFSPSWGSKFTLNINVEMNYWPASLSNLAECASPIVDLVERMAERGKHTAQTMYGCRGWCAHSYTDIWADCDPHDDWMPATLWPLGGMWITSDAVENLKYHYDRAVHERLAPVLQGAVQFLLDFLVPSADGAHLVTSPSLSPENTYLDANGAEGIFCEGSAMDMTLIRRAFELYLWTSNTLSLANDETLVSQVHAALARLPPLHVSPATGLIQEWGVNDYGEAEPGHRHVSHLVGLYPGRDITSSTPDLQDAARKVLARRAASGGGHTGWSRAWLINLHARLGDADEAANHIAQLLAKSTMPNMLDDHPPFQIDGNFGGCAGVLECLVQSHLEGEKEDRVVIQLLPATPSGWEQGEVHGVCVMGGWSVSFKWKDGKVEGEVTVRCADTALANTASVVFPSGEGVTLSGVGEHVVARPVT